MTPGSIPPFIKIGVAGTFHPSSSISTSQAEIDAIFKRVREPDISRVTLYFHGGLTPIKAGLEVAERMPQVFGDASFPIVFVWETGFLESVYYILNNLASTKFFRSSCEHIRAVVEKRAASKTQKGGGGNSTDDPDTLRDLIQSDLLERLQSEPDLDAIFDDWSEMATPSGSTTGPEENPRPKGGISALLAGLLATAACRVINRMYFRRDHGIGTTIIEEILRLLPPANIGKSVWDAMKDKAEAMWLPDAGRTGDDRHVGLYVLGRLGEIQRDKPGLLVDAVGHSAGSIAICHLLAQVEKTLVRINNVIFLAPACTVELFQHEVVDHQGRFNQFLMMTMRDEQELEDQLVPMVYPHSLLYLVSGAFEAGGDTPILGMARHTTGQEPYAEPKLVDVHSFLFEQGVRRVIWAGDQAGDDGLSSEARSHGAFDDDPATLRSLVALAKS